MNIKIGTIINHPGSTFNGKLQEKYNVVMTGYLTRDKNGSLYIWIGEAPIKNECGFWGNCGGSFAFIDADLFPDVKWEDDYPTEVTIKIM